MDFSKNGLWAMLRLGWTPSEIRKSPPSSAHVLAHVEMGKSCMSNLESFRSKKSFGVGGYYLLLEGCRGRVFGIDFASITPSFTQDFEYSLNNLFILYHKIIVLLFISPYTSHDCMGFYLSICWANWSIVRTSCVSMYASCSRVIFPCLYRACGVLLYSLSVMSMSCVCNWG